MSTDPFVFKNFIDFDAKDKFKGKNNFERICKTKLYVMAELRK
jgi:hypothetical protein